MIRFAKDEDHPQLEALWQVCFGDSEAAIRFYFANRHQNQNMLVYEVEGGIAGMLTMLPVQLAFGQDIRSGRYIYAVATAPQFRGQGISSQLLLECHVLMGKTGEAAAILNPASDSLFTFYGKRGYKTVFYVNSTSLDPSDLPPCPPEAVCTPCHTADFFRLRNAVFSDCSLFVRWGTDQLEYVIRGAQAFGDGVYYFRTESGEGYAVCGWRERSIFIREIGLINLEIPVALSILHRNLGAEAYNLRLPAGTVEGAAQHPFGMIHYLGDKPVLEGKPPYLSLVLD